MEANLLAGQPLNHWSFYSSIGFATSIFYTLVYYVSSKRINPQLVSFDWNNRSVWYSHNRTFVRISLILSCLALVFSGVFFLYRNYAGIFRLSIRDCFLIILFPLLALSYSFKLPFTNKFSLRKFGILKPFILGFAWAGFVTAFPIIALKAEGTYELNSRLPEIWLFMQNFIFISLLCIIFDIKDEQSDRKQQIRTIPVLLGIRQTVYFIIIPLTIINLFIKATVMYAYQNPFLPIIIRAVPNIILVAVSLQVRSKKSTLYYLAIIDGMMLVKALTGIISIYL
jgi:4-hydroxybenzoate polyprenyltransferase